MECVEVARHEGIILHSIWGRWLRTRYIWQHKVCFANEVPAAQAPQAYTAGLWAGWVRRDTSGCVVWLR